MKKTKLALFAALLSLGAAAPAFADWDNIGSVDVSRGNDRRDNRDNDRGGFMRRGGMDHDTVQFRLGGPVERLQLTADRGDVFCRSVRADFGNGRDSEIFQGRLQQGRSTSVDVPGQARTLSGLNFSCTTDDRRGATIRISADIGRYQADWRRNPDFERVWSRMFNWGSNTFNNWRMIGTESFEGRRDSENTFVGPRGRRIDAIALKPIGADARCSRVVGRFDNGRDQDLGVNNGDVLRSGQYYKVDLPGNYRNLDSLSLRCQAINSRQVSIQIFTSR